MYAFHFGSSLGFLLLVLGESLRVASRKVRPLHAVFFCFVWTIDVCCVDNPGNSAWLSESLDWETWNLYWPKQSHLYHANSIISYVFDKTFVRPKFVLNYTKFLNWVWNTVLDYSMQSTPFTLQSLIWHHASRGLNKMMNQKEKKRKRKSRTLTTATRSVVTSFLFKW